MPDPALLDALRRKFMPDATATVRPHATMAADPGARDPLATTTRMANERHDAMVAAAREQLAKRGITDEQHDAGYTPRLSDALYHDITPSSVTGDPKKIALRALQHVLRNDVAPGADPVRDWDGDNTDEKSPAIPAKDRNGHFVQQPASEDMWSTYLGLPQRYGNVGVSSYRPRNSTSDGPYLKDEHYYDDMKGDHPEWSPGDQVKEIRYQRSLGRPRVSASNYELGRYKLDESRDENGPYISYYDKYDFTGDVPGADNIGHPYEVYDRLYYDEKTGKALKVQPNGHRK